MALHQTTKWSVVMKLDTGGYDPCGRSDYDRKRETVRSEEEGKKLLTTLRETRNFEGRYVDSAWLESVVTTRHEEFT